MTHFAVAGLQLVLAAQDNLHLVRSELERLKQRFPWVDMAVLAELSLFGPNTGNAQPLPGRVEDALCQIARDLNIWLVPGSIYERDGDRIYNTTPVINPAGEVVARYRKMFPFLPYEKGITPGSEFVVFDVPDVGRFGVSICYDMWFPETTRTLAWMGAEVIIHPTMTNTIDRDVELAIARSNAATNQCYFIDINCAGRLGFGRSVVIGPDGSVIHQAGSGHEIIPVELDLELVRRSRRRGLLGLGQALKSFRDSDVQFPPYQAGRRNSEALAKLGAHAFARSRARREQGLTAFWTKQSSPTGPMGLIQARLSFAKISVLTPTDHIQGNYMRKQIAPRRGTSRQLTSRQRHAGSRGTATSGRAPTAPHNGTGSSDPAMQQPHGSMPRRNVLAVSAVAAGLQLTTMGAASLAYAATDEIIVTATRREQTVQEIPFNISAVSGDALEKANIIDAVEALRTVPGISIQDRGYRNSGVTNGIVIRGINVDAGTQGDVPLAAPPTVATYVDNTALYGNFILKDIERVEVLRGPQGTLYGSGSLAGNVRYIMAKPSTEGFSGKASISAGVTDGSDGYNVNPDILLNMPLSDTTRPTGQCRLYRQRRHR